MNCISNLISLSFLVGLQQILSCQWKKFRMVSQEDYEKTIRHSQQMRMLQSTVLTSNSMKLEEHQELKHTYRTHYSTRIIHYILELVKKQAESSIQLKNFLKRDDNASCSVRSHQVSIQVLLQTETMEKIERSLYCLLFHHFPPADEVFGDKCHSRHNCFLTTFSR